MAATPLYFVFQDLNPKKNYDTKIEESLARYRQLFGEPTVILVHKHNTVTKTFGVLVRDDDMVRIDHIYIGHDGDSK